MINIKEAQEHKSTYAIVASNLVPLIGVFLCGWDLRDVLLAYWVESGVVGVFNVLKMFFAYDSIKTREKRFKILGWAFSISAKNKTAEERNNLFAFIVRIQFIATFASFFLMFMLIHGVFIIALTSGGGLKKGVFINYFTLKQVFKQTYPALVAFLISHGFSFFRNYLQRNEYQRATLGALMVQPYLRIFIMQLSLILGIGIVSLLGFTRSAGVLVFLVVIKTLLDVRAHIQERKRFSSPVN